MTNPGLRGPNPETRVPKPDVPGEKRPDEICPNCGGELDPRQCKVFCGTCGILVYNCSEF